MRLSRRHSITRPHFPEGVERIHTPYLGTPWLRGGRERVLGVDCLGMVVLWIKAAGLPIVDPCSTDPHDVINSEFRSQFYPVAEPDFGDVVRFKTGEEFHLAVVLFDGLLQATTRHGVHVAPLPNCHDCKAYRHKQIAARIKAVEGFAQC